MRWRSTTFRFAALVFLCQIAAAAVLLFAMGAILRTQSAANARAVAETVREDLLDSYAQGGTPELVREINLRRTQQIKRGAVMLITDGGGQLLAGDLATWPSGLATGGGYTEIALHRIGHVAPETMLVRATRLPGGEKLLTGIAVESERELFGLLERASLLALALGLVIAAFAAWLATRLIVARLHPPIDTLAAVRRGELGQRVQDDDSGDAFAELGGEINRTLDRVQALIGELKIATDSMAHDLKSPLTRLRVTLERAAEKVREPEAQEAIERAQAEGARLLSLVETALSISRAEAGIGRESFAEFDLAELLRTIAEIYGPLVEDDGREILLDIPAPVIWRAHRQLLGQAIGNLIDNALKYGAGPITLTLAADAVGPVIAVTDQGVGIPEAQRAEALKRFGRLDAARSGTGAGLGLSLVQAVAHLHGGAAELDDAEPGLTVRLRLA